MLYVLQFGHSREIMHFDAPHRSDNDASVVASRKAVAINHKLFSTGFEERRVELARQLSVLFKKQRLIGGAVKCFTDVLADCF